MTPDEHYAAAEDLLERSAHSTDPSEIHALASRAQAHFTAATSAAAMGAARVAEAAVRADQERSKGVSVAGLLADLTDPDSCEFDHHGYCQAHGWMQTEPRCPHARAKELLAAAGVQP